MKRIGLLFAMLTLTVCVFGQSHTIDFTQPINGLDGKALTQPDGKEVLTLGDVAVNSLESLMAGDATLTGQQKFEMDSLARKVYKKKSVTLTVEELKLLKERIGKFYAGTVVGAAWRMLDPNQEK